MQDQLQAPKPSRRPGLLRIVDTGAAARPSRAALLHDAHAALARAEANLLSLAAPHRPPPSGRAPLFRRDA